MGISRLESLDIPMHSVKDWKRMHRALKLAAGIFTEREEEYSKCFAECGWKLDGVDRLELLGGLERHRVDGILPCTPFFSLEQCSQLGKAMGLSGASVLSLQDEGLCDIEPASKDVNIWGHPAWQENMIGSVSPTGLSVCLKKELLFTTTVALLAYKAFLNDSPSIYAGLASASVSGALWLLLEQSYIAKKTKEIQDECQKEKHWVEDVLYKIQLFYSARPDNAVANGTYTQRIKEISSLFDEQKMLSARMRVSLEEQRILRSSSGGMLI